MLDNSKTTLAENWLDVLRQYVEAKCCVFLRLDEDDCAQLSASSRGFSEFTLARPHDAFSGIRTPTVCLIFGRTSDGAGRESGGHIAYIGLVSSCHPITTLDTRIKIRRSLRLVPVTEQAIAALLTSTPHAGQLRRTLQSTSTVLVLSPKLSGALVNALAEIPQNQTALRTLAESLSVPKRYNGSAAMQEDAVQTALKAFGLAAGDRALDVKLADGRPTALARVPLMEDAVIEHDARSIPGYTLSASDITGRALFEKGTEKLEVFTANRRDLEHVFGVDLIYLNLTKKNIVMVQYKMLEPNASTERTDWIYRPEPTMVAEVRRMKTFAVTHAPGPFEYRLNPSVFYLKFVKRNGSLSDGGIITPVDHYERLLLDPACAGPRGAFRISYDTLSGRYLRQTAFQDLIRSGYIGAYTHTTQQLATLVQAVLDGDRAVIVAVQSPLRAAAAS